MVTIKGYEVPNTVEELTVEQFDKLNTIETKQDLDALEKWLTKFEYLGVPEDAFDDMELKELQDIVAKFNEGWEVPKNKTTSVEIEGYTYEARESLSVKDLSLIEKAWKKTPENFAVKMCAVLFKRTDLDRTEHYTDAHLKHKANLFKKQPCYIAVPYVTDVIETLLKNTEELNDTEPLEANNG